MDPVKAFSTSEERIPTQSPLSSFFQNFQTYDMGFISGSVEITAQLIGFYPKHFNLKSLSNQKRVRETFKISSCSAFKKCEKKHIKLLFNNVWRGSLKCVSCGQKSLCCTRHHAHRWCHGAPTHLGVHLYITAARGEVKTQSSAKTVCVNLLFGFSAMLDESSWARKDHVMCLKAPERSGEWLLRWDWCVDLLFPVASCGRLRKHVCFRWSHRRAGHWLPGRLDHISLYSFDLSHCGQRLQHDTPQGVASQLGQAGCSSLLHPHCFYFGWIYIFIYIYSYDRNVPLTGRTNNI